MIRHFLSTSAVVLALATSAWAQTATDQPTTTPPPPPAEEQQPMAQPEGTTEGKPEAVQPSAGTAGTEGAIIPEQAETQLRAEDLIRPLLRPSLCAIQKERDERGFPTLGIFKPATIRRLVIEPTEAHWSTDQLAKLNQTLSLFDTAPASQLEKIPFNFKYEFSCADPDCDGHLLSCTDWEAGQSYRKWRKEYGSGWEQAFRQKYEQEMRDRFDTHFFVGNIHQYPNAWIIVGLFYPPRLTTGDLFDN